MAAEPVKVPVPLCETCWLIDHTRWEPESMDDKGQILMRLTGVDIPQKVNTDSVDVCALCGGITVAGIYDMCDPATVDYLKETDDPLSDTSTQFVLGIDEFVSDEDEDLQ